MAKEQIATWPKPFQPEGPRRCIHTSFLLVFAHLESDLALWQFAIWPFPPMSRRLINPRTGLTAAIFTLIILAFAPPGVAGWVGAFSGPVRTILAPIAAPFEWVLSLRLSDRELSPNESESLSLMRQERDGYLRETNQLRAENDELRRVIAELQQGLDLNPAIPVRQFQAPVIGSSMELSSRVLTVRAGSREGVEPTASVAVVRGVHLVGRVIGVKDRFCSVQPFTDTSAGSIKGVVMLGATQFGPACFLVPRGDGTLAGQLMTEPTLLPTGATTAAADAAGGDPSAGVKPGMIVRLGDERWPQSAQMLEIGIVEAVETPPDNIRIRTIVIRPRYRIDRVSEVTLRVPAASSTGGAP